MTIVQEKHRKRHSQACHDNEIVCYEFLQNILNTIMEVELYKNAKLSKTIIFSIYYQEPQIFWANSFTS